MDFFNGTNPGDQWLALAAHGFTDHPDQPPMDLGDGDTAWFVQQIGTGRHAGEIRDTYVRASCDPFPWCCPVLRRPWPYATALMTYPDLPDLG